MSKTVSLSRCGFAFIGLGRHFTSSATKYQQFQHECEREAADVATIFSAILKEHCDAASITVWCDNCVGQNKNYSLFLSLVALINSDEIAAETITLKYFEPGKIFFIQRSVNITLTAIFCILHFVI